jgi:transposase
MILYNNSNDNFLVNIMEKFNSEEKLRKSVIKYLKEHTTNETANFFELGTATVSRWKAQYENEGTLTSAKKGGATYSIVTEEGKQFILSEVENNNDITLAELKQKYLKKFNEIIGESTISYHLKKLNISRKKKVSTTPIKIKKALKKNEKNL